jgi:sulfatase modifying factor 1
MLQSKGTHRVNRGGGWNNTARNCRCANRNANQPSNRNNNLGLRPAAPAGLEGPGAFPVRRDLRLDGESDYYRPTLLLHS